MRRIRLTRKTRRGSKRQGKSAASPLDAPIPAQYRWRIYLVLLAFLTIYGVVAARLTQLQTQPASRFAREDDKHVGEIKIHRARGDIFDRNGRILATDRKLPSLSANPSALADPAPLAAHLRRTLGLNRKELARLSQRDAKGNLMKFVWLRRWLTEEELDAAGPLDEIPGGHALRVQMEPVRYYPERTLAAHVLGFANREGLGGGGIELTYDRYLRSSAGKQVSRVDNRRNILGFLTLEYEPPQGGDDVHLTLDTTLQYELEKALDEAMALNKAPRAMGILMDPNTGAVLALATRPAFDPNRYNQYGPELRRNRAVVDVFEPGSVFKVVTAAAALEHGLITRDTEIDCEGGSFNPYGHRIRDVHKLDIEPVSVCFAQSSNIAIIKIAALLGEERLDAWIRAFGFGSKTGIDLPSESAGIYHPRHRWSRLSMGSLPMGQEIAITVPQLAAAFSLIANGGYAVKPHLVDRVLDENGATVYQFDPGPRQRILSDAISREMRELCHLVVQGENTGRRAAIAEYRVGGKTGTAQIARPDGRGYYTGRDAKYTTVFAGFAPVNDPRLVCVIVIPEPNIRNHYGGYVCGPVFKKVVRDALIRMNVPADPMLATTIEDGPLLETDLFDADTVAGRELFEFEPPVTAAATVLLDGLELMGAHEDSYGEGEGLPRLTGLTKRQAIENLIQLGIAWDAEGAGRVIFQEPLPGTPLKEIRHCRLVFGTPANTKEDGFIAAGYDD